MRKLARGLKRVMLSLLSLIDVTDRDSDPTPFFSFLLTRSGHKIVGAILCLNKIICLGHTPCSILLPVIFYTTTLRHYLFIISQSIF